MAQDKRVFTGGMDKDSDPRLIKNGDYRDALNIRNISSSDSTSGSVENIEGNTIVPNQKFIDEENQVISIGLELKLKQIQRINYTTYMVQVDLFLS